MKIVSLQANNFKRLKAIEIRPDGSVVVIRGKNGQGKTSVLDVIWAGLGGKRAVPKKPIRDGETRADLTLDLGEYVVTRTFTETDSYLTVKNADGGVIKNPQALCDGLIGSISFDPLEFARMQTSEMVKRLADVTGLDFAPLNAKRQEMFAQRTEVNRRHKACVARLEAHEKEHGKPKLGLLADAEAPQDDLIAEYETANAKHLEMAGLRGNERRLEDSIETAHSEVARLRNMIAEVEKGINRDQTTLIQVRATVVEAQKALPDLEDIKARMTAQKQTEYLIQKAQEWQKLYADTAEAGEQADGLTRALEDIDSTKGTMLAKAKLPINGLSFDEDGVFFNGIPFAECCDSEKLKVSTAIAMALNPKLRVIRITDGSLLDAESMAILEAMADDEDFQIWVERVESPVNGTYSEGIGVIIEDGSVLTTEQK